MDLDARDSIYIYEEYIIIKDKMKNDHNKRNEYIDTIKGVLIILVVFGHFLEGSYSNNLDCSIRCN